jgi:hypothetical protein
MVTPCDVPVGVITGDDVVKLLKHAKENGYAIPAFNCTRCAPPKKGCLVKIHRVVPLYGILSVSP